MLSQLVHNGSGNGRDLSWFRGRTDVLGWTQATVSRRGLSMISFLFHCCIAPKHEDNRNFTVAQKIWLSGLWKYDVISFWKSQISHICKLFSGCIHVCFNVIHTVPPKIIFSSRLCKGFDLQWIWQQISAFVSHMLQYTISTLIKCRLIERFLY